MHIIIHRQLSTYCALSATVLLISDDLMLGDSNFKSLSWLSIDCVVITLPPSLNKI